MSSSRRKQAFKWRYFTLLCNVFLLLQLGKKMTGERHLVSRWGMKATSGNLITPSATSTSSGSMCRLTRASMVMRWQTGWLRLAPKSIIKAETMVSVIFFFCVRKHDWILVFHLICLNCLFFFYYLVLRCSFWLFTFV